MTSQETVELKWGVVGLGAFARKWVIDVFTNYHHDEANGHLVKHTLAAVLSTSSLEKAQSFVEGLPESVYRDDSARPTTYINADEFFDSGDTNVIYIAAPNAFHYELALKALNSGKNVLVEKTFTINHKQALKLKELASQKGLFILDGVWTRFLPTTKAIQSLINQENIIGHVHRVSADLSHDCPFDNDNRMYNPNLGAGVLYDNLIYAITWSDLILYSQAKKDPTINSWSILSEDVPGIDTSTGISLSFSDINAVGIATGSFEIESPKEGALIEGKDGYIRVEGVSRPHRAVLYTKENKEGTVLDLPEIKGIGYYYEANVAAKLFRESALEPKEYPLDRSIKILKIFDEVKRQNGIKFPEHLERV